MKNKIALAPCNGMSPNGLVSRVACGDATKENENLISICMGSTSADIDGKNNEMLKKFPIISVNGCNNACVNTILENKGINVAKTVIVDEILSKTPYSAKNAFRLDDEAEECVKALKKELVKITQHP